MDIVNLPIRSAKYFKYRHYADCTLVHSMEKHLDRVLLIFNDVVQGSLNKALKGWQELQNFVKNKGYDGPLKAWHIIYLSECFKKIVFGL